MRVCTGLTFNHESPFR